MVSIVSIAIVSIVRMVRITRRLLVFSDGVVRVGGEKVEGHTGTAATRTACAGYI